MTEGFQELRGLPQTTDSPNTPVGQIAQAGKLADAVLTQTGWKLIGARILFALLALSLVAPLVFWAINAVR